MAERGAPPFVKICGVTRPEHVVAAQAAGAAFIGLMFAPRSRRRLTVEEAHAVLAPLPARTMAAAPTLPLGAAGLWFERCARALEELIAQGRPLVTGVFADQPVSLVNAIAEQVDLDLIQLSGDEPWETCLALRRPAIKALRAGPAALGAELLAQAEAGTAALCLVDADVPGSQGGAGVPANWQAAAELARALPVMLAGGLTPANVGAAVARVRPWAVDVSSGVERDGVKDVMLIEQFVRAARSVPPADGAGGVGERHDG